MPLFPKTLKIALSEVLPVVEDKEHFGPDVRKLHDITVRPPNRKFTIDVDDVVVLEIPDITHYTIRDPQRLRQIDERLRLLEEVLRMADTYGTALVIRKPDGTYSVPSSENIRFIDRDGEDG